MIVHAHHVYFGVYANLVMRFNVTRPKPVEHGYVFSMAVSSIGEWLTLVPFFLGDEQFILRDVGGGGLAVFLAVTHLKIKVPGSLRE